MTYEHMGLGALGTLRDEAREHYNLGSAAFDAGRYQEALTEFTAAENLVSHPTTRLAIAQSLAGLNRCEEALRIFVEIGSTRVLSADQVRAMNHCRSLLDAQTASAPAAEQIVMGQGVSVKPQQGLVGGVQTAVSQAEQAAQAVAQAATNIASQEGAAAARDVQGGAAAGSGADTSPWYVRYRYHMIGGAAALTIWSAALYLGLRSKIAKEMS